MPDRHDSQLHRTPPVQHGSMGATETLDFSLGDWHTGTLNANCAITVTGFTNGDGLVTLVQLTQDGTGGWDVTWDSDIQFTGDDQPDQTAGSVTFFSLWTSEGNSAIYGAKVGGGSSISLSDDTPLADSGSGDPGVSTEASRSDHVHPASSSTPPPILLESGHAVPFTFDDILQSSDGEDFLWESE